MLPSDHLEPWHPREVGRTHHLRTALHGHHQQLFSEPNLEEEHLRARNRSQLNSSNGYARFRWMRCLGAPLFQLLGADAPDYVHSGPVYLLSITDRRHVWLSADEQENSGAGPNVSLDRIRYDLEQVVRGLDALGMIDVASYVSAGKVLGHPHVYHPHLHALVWNRTRKQMARLCRRLNQSLRPLQPNATAAHWREVRPGDIRQVLWYCLKSPRDQHQMWVRANGAHRQAKRLINGVNAVRLHALMRDLTLDQLTIAAGAGRPILAHAVADAERWRANAVRRGVVLKNPPKDPPEKPRVKQTLGELVL